MPDAVAFIDTVAHPVAWDYYEAFPSEPILPDPETIVVRSKVRVDRMTWHSLLEAIVRHAPMYGSILVVTHGTRRGIFIPIASGGPILDTNQIFDAFSIGSQLETVVARRYGVSPALLNDLYRRRLDVQSLHLNRVELRACNVGRGHGSMNKLLRILQCESLGCPRGRDSFFSPLVTTIRPTGTSVAVNANMSWANWDSLYARQHRFDETIAGSRVSLYYEETEHSRLSAAVGSESLTAMQEWIRRRQPGGTWNGGALPMHALVGRPPVFPGQVAFRGGLVRIGRTGNVSPPQ